MIAIVASYRVTWTTHQLWWCTCGSDDCDHIAATLACLDPRSFPHLFPGSTDPTNTTNRKDQP